MNILANIAHLAWVLHASCIPGKAICYTKHRESGVSGCIGMSDRSANHRTFDSCNEKVVSETVKLLSCRLHGDYCVATVQTFGGCKGFSVLSQRCRLPLYSLFSIGDSKF